MSKPRLLFVLLGVRNECILKYIQPALHKHLNTENIYYYKVWEHDFPNTTNYYQSWFTDIMIKKGSNEVIVVIHDENSTLMGEIFDNRMKAFHSIYNYTIVEAEFRKEFEVLDSEHKFSDEEYEKKLSETHSSYWELFGHLINLNYREVYKDSTTIVKLKFV